MEIAVSQQFFYALSKRFRYHGNGRWSPPQQVNIIHPRAFRDAALRNYFLPPSETPLCCVGRYPPLVAEHKSRVR